MSFILHHVHIFFVARVLGSHDIIPLLTRSDSSDCLFAHSLLIDLVLVCSVVDGIRMDLNSKKLCRTVLGSPVETGQKLGSHPDFLRPD